MKPKEKFTPGPWWRVDSNMHRIRGKKGPVCDIVWSANEDANAHLIAAAPAMYEALNYIKQHESLSKIATDFVAQALALADGGK